MFGITAGYHRFFSHRSFKTSRVFQFVLAWLGACSAQLGPLWWAAHHRHHHQYSDTHQDAHTPGLKGFLWAHMGWVFCPRNQVTHYHRVRDFCHYPELLFLERNWLLPPALMALSTLAWGWWLGRNYPAWGTHGLQLLTWGFFLSTILVYHATFCINSMAHLWGSRRYETKDDSRNNWVLALITLGEGWHNNHHKYPSSERQGFYWWEIDMTHYGLKCLAALGLVWDLRTPPKGAYHP
jgi:stearoyl-CoA desaturase (delta-9 desaturase)